MFQRYAMHEFYADLLSHRLAWAKKWWDRVLFFTFVALFVAAWLGLVFRKEETSALMERYGGVFTQWLFEEPYSQQRIIGIFGLLFLTNVAPSLTFFVRKNWIFPKASMSLQGYAAVQSKKVVKLPRGRGATKTPMDFYVYVAHPVTGKVVPVAVSENWYSQLEVGNRVHARYHPSSDNVLYLIKTDH